MKGVRITISIGYEDERYRNQETVTFDEGTAIKIAKWKIQEMFKMLKEERPGNWMTIEIQSEDDL